MKNKSWNSIQISQLCLELSMVLHSGIGTADALNLLAKGEEDVNVKKVLYHAQKDMDEGLTLSKALEKSGVFPAYVVGLIETGELSGRLEESLSSLSRYYESRANMERRLYASLLYPAIMVFLMLIVIGVLLIKVLPIFNEVYVSLGSKLSGIAGGLLAVGNFLGSILPVLLIILAAIVVFAILVAAVKSFRNKLLVFWRKRGGDRGVFRAMNNAQLMEAMSMGMDSGLSGVEAVRLAGRLMDETSPAKARCEKCAVLLEDGVLLQDALERSHTLTPTQSQLLAVAAKTGSQDAAMSQLAVSMSEESEAKLEDAISKIEPILVLVCAVLVGIILLSVMLPLTNIMSTIN